MDALIASLHTPLLRPIGSRDSLRAHLGAGRGLEYLTGFIGKIPASVSLGGTALLIAGGVIVALRKTRGEAVNSASAANLAIAARPA